MNHFTDEEEHREVAALFNTRIREIKTAHEQEKALKETILIARITVFITDSR